MASIVKSTNTGVSDVIAAFDLGSNSIKMTVARRGTIPNHVDEFLWRSETVRLGLGVDQSGELASDRMAAALDTLRRFSDEAREAGATRLIGVATEATRVARNGDVFLDQVKHLTGIEIQSISGDREATLTFLGLQGALDLGGKLIVADIGGGSTEIIVAQDERIEWSRSFALGSGRLAERFIVSDPPVFAELEACRQDALAILADAPLGESAGGRLIIVGGTGEYINKMLPPDVPREPLLLQNLIRQFTALHVSELATKLDIVEARARVLPAGVAIALAIADAMHPSRFEAAQSGIRRGLLLAAFAGEV